MNKSKILNAAVIALFLGCADIPDELREDAESDGTCGSSIYNPSTSFCYGGDVYAKCDGIKYNPTIQICKGIVVTDAVCGDSQYSQYYNPLEQGCCVSATFNLANQRCLSNVVETKCGSGWYDSLTYLCINGMAIKEGTFTDVRDSKIYRWVKIGSQIWMAKNLNYNASNSRCYGEGGLVFNVETRECDITLSNAEIQANCNKYGRLYDWSTAMAGSASSATNPSGVKGVCPTGWHLPSDAEWRALESAVDGYAGTKLKATSGWAEDEEHWRSGNGTDEYGFSALPGGGGISDGSFYDAGYYGSWWTATEDYASFAYHRHMNYNNADVGSRTCGKSCLYSVRCVQD